MGSKSAVFWQTTGSLLAGIAIGYVVRGWLSPSNSADLQGAKQVARDTREAANSLRFTQNRKAKEA